MSILWTRCDLFCVWDLSKFDSISLFTATLLCLNEVMWCMVHSSGC